MAVTIAEVAATGANLRDEAAHAAIVRRWHQWAHEPGTKDVGNQTRHVLAAAAEHGISAARAPRHGRDARGQGGAGAMDRRVRALRSLPDDVGAVVSLCRIGDFDVPASVE